MRQAQDIYESHARAEIPVVELGDNRLTSQEIDWTPLLPPVAAVENVLSLTDREADELLRLPMRPGGVSEVETTFLHAATFLDKAGRRRVPRTAIMCDRASYFVQAVEMCLEDEPLRDGLRKVVLGGTTKHRMRPERILVSDEKLFKVLGPACARIGIELGQVDKLVAAPDALESLARHLRGGVP